ncbi:MAG TPA: SAM-dependent methyltransferase [Pseudonocardiaceae bacterium]|nr:SAM-dependent methyltransferase [Pseudonocardiaceae bacterium]
MTDNRAARTAIGPMVIVALDQYDPHPLIRDDLAARLLPGATRLMVAACRWRPLRQAVVRLTEKQMPGLWAGMLCRKRYIDDAVTGGPVVILGAGMDTRAYRLPDLGDVYEVDQPGSIERKRRLVTSLLGTVPDTLVPTDFETQDVADTLAAAGYRPDRPTTFVWEAVTQYLTQDAVHATFGFLATAPAGSRLVFTYVRKDFLDGRNLYGAAAAYQNFVVRNRLWKFGWAPDEVPDFLAGYGWRQVEQVGPAELTERYVRPSGRDLPVSEIERTVLAEKVS